MPESYTALYLHLIFSTKTHQPFIEPDIKQRLYDYMGGILKQEGGVLLAAGGTEDHVHLLVSIHPQVAVSDVLRRIKGNSSKWIHETFPQRSEFAWQKGYGAFSVSKSSVSAVTAYIANQEEHHRRMSFHEEFVRFLKKHGISFDERYVG